MSTLEQIISDSNFRRFFFKWAPQIFIGGLGLFSTIGLAAISVLYLGMQDLSLSSAVFTADVRSIEQSVSSIENDVARNSAAVTTLTVDQGTSNARIQIYRSDVNSILESISDLMELINANELSSKLENRTTELEILIRLELLELRRIQGINADSESSPTEIEAEAERSLLQSIAEKRRELESLRGF